MRLEFEKEIINREIYEELGFADFLQLFNINLPLIPRKILRPLTHHEGEKHFKELSFFSEHFTKGSIDLKKIERQLSTTPAIEPILPFFRQQNLEQFHLYALASFIRENQILEEMESALPLQEQKNKVCQKIKKILVEYSSDDFASIKLSSKEEEIKNNLEKIKKQLVSELNHFEKEILAQTGLKMIYPYPKEINRDSPLMKKIGNCQLLSTSANGEFVFIDYLPDEKIKNLQQEEKELKDTFSEMIEKKLTEINHKLSSLFEPFHKYLSERIRRSYLYALLIIAKREMLILPQITKFEQAEGINIEGGILPTLQQSNPHQYVPLNVKLSEGSNLLFGSNMTGKTTVLKTVFFHLSLIRFGLPVPAKSIDLHFPQNVEFHLKSSGNIKTHLSSFGDELNFFSKKTANSSYILVDELFHSTNPLCGAKLSEIFLEHFAGQNVVFFCTSHYPEVLKIDKIQLLRMKDPPQEKIEDNEKMSLAELQHNIPYQLEIMPAGTTAQLLEESKKPLLMALHFPLDKNIKERIRNEIKD